MNFARAERAALCDLLLERGPNAPTLCEGWRTRDLTTHLILRESDLPATIGMFVPRFASVTQRHAYDLSTRNAFPTLVERLRSGPGKFSPFGIAPVDRAMNTIEFFVHHEDARRAGASPLPPRNLEPAQQAALWDRLTSMTRLMFSRVSVGVVLETDAGQRLRVRPGTSTVHVVGPVGELVLFATGRTTAAEVEIVGLPDSVTQLRTSLGY